MLNGSYLRCRMKKITEWLALKTEMVQNREVIKEVFSSVDRSWVYYIALLTAGLIALLGLLTNSVAVVIGAMLISPLMGPIISSGLAFTIGDLPLARRAFKTISISVGAHHSALRPGQLPLPLPVALAIVTTPMLPELRFAGDGSLTPESARELEIIKRLPEGAAGFRFRIGALRKNQKQAESLRRHLARELAVPETLLVPVRLSARGAPPAGVSLRIVRR